MWIWGSITSFGSGPASVLYAPAERVGLDALSGASIFGADLESLRGHNVLLATREQLPTALALIELDGLARRMVVCPPGLSPEHFAAIIRDADIDVIAGDLEVPEPGRPGVRRQQISGSELIPGTVRRYSHETEWVLLTSGTSGAPKLVLHTLSSLTSALSGARPRPITWSTFYDIRRYGGLQIFLRALHGGSLLLSDPQEPTEDFLRRAGASQITHISGTPSHWRKALMSNAISHITPEYVRLSGEIVDQAILDALQHAFPAAVVAHAFASTEAGVGFEVRDGLAGFPADITQTNGVQIDTSGGTLRLKSGGNAQRYLTTGAPELKDPDGFVSNADLLERRGDRYMFVGRGGGVINVGGLKVHPEEVEAVINSHPQVRMSLVTGRRNPITGAVVVADVVLAAPQASPAQDRSIVDEVMSLCRSKLAAHKVPMSMRVVPTLNVSPSGKLVRPYA